MFVLKQDGSDGETPQLHETLQAALDLGAVLFDQPAIGHQSTIVARDNDFLSMYGRHGRSLLGSNAADAQMAAARRRLQRKIRWPRVDERGQNNAGPAAGLSSPPTPGCGAIQTDKPRSRSVGTL